MDVFSFVLAIVAIGCAAGVINNYLKLQKKRAVNEVPEDYVAQIDELRARIEVLEKIVTDEKYDLQRQINDL